LAIEVSGCALGDGSVLVLQVLPATAQMRSIPLAARRAAMSHVEGMTVTLDGDRAQLAPGAQIRGPTVKGWPL